MVRRALLVLCLGLMTVLLASCGQTYELQSISVTPGTLDSAGNSQINLVGDGAFQQLTVTAKYSNTKTKDVTVHSSYQLNASKMGDASDGRSIAPLTSVAVNNSGMVNVLDYACTWDTEPTSSADTAWYYTIAPYQVKVTYTENGVTATALMDVTVVNLNNGGYCFDGTDFTPTSGFKGNSVVGYGI
jgi:hypothetical protein